MGLVLGAEKLKPISWSEWAGQIEREGGARNPFRRLEERYGFWDVRVSFLPGDWLWRGVRLGWMADWRRRRESSLRIGFGRRIR